MKTAKLQPGPDFATDVAAEPVRPGIAQPPGAQPWAGPEAPPAALHPWLAFLLEPWLAAIERAGPGSTHWLQETSAAMSDCLRDWVDLTPAIERALDKACRDSDLLVACINRTGWSNADAQRRVARAAMGALIEALGRAAASDAKADHGLGF